MTTEKKVSRRKFIAAGTGIVVVAAAAGAAYYLTKPGPTPTPIPTPTPTPTVTVATTTAPPTATGPKRGGKLIWANPQTIPALDPMNSTSNIQFFIFEQMYDTLFNLQNDYTVTPRLATSWKASSDGLEYRIQLRQGVKFHDGIEFEAKDVAATFNAIRDRKTVAWAVTCPPFKTVEASSKYEVRFTLEQRFYPFIEHLASTWLYIVAERYADDPAKNPIGTGPFKFVDWKMGEFFRHERNKDYWEPGLPYLDELEERDVPEGSTRVAQLLAGEAHYALLIPPELASQVDRDPNTELFSTLPGARWNFIGINCANKPLDDVRVRLALNYCIDRKRFLQTIMRGYGRIFTTWCHPDMPEYANLPDVPRDVEKAKALLKDAGYPDGIPRRFTYLVASEFPDMINMAMTLQDLAKPAGFNIDLVSVPWTDWLDRVPKLEWDFTGCFDERRPSAHSFIWGRFPAKEFYNAFNWFKADPEYEAKIRDACLKGMVELDLEKRKPYYVEAQKMIYDRVPVIPLIFHNIIDGKRKELKGVKTLSPVTNLFFKEAWIQ